MDVQTRVGMPMDEFIREYDKAPFELVNGRVIPRLPRVAIHAVVQMNLFMALERQCGSLGKVYVGAAFISVDEQEHVTEAYDPVVSFYSSAHWQAYTQNTTDWLDKPIMIAPDVAAKIVWRDDTYEDADDIIAGYTRQGVKLLWLVKARSEAINVFAGNNLKRLTLADTLTGGDVLPDFSVSIADLFPKT